MKGNIKFLIELAKIYEIAEQLSGTENEQAIFKVTKMYLEQNNLNVADIRNEIENNKNKNLYRVLDNLISSIEWKDKHTK